MSLSGPRSSLFHTRCPFLNLLEFLPQSISAVNHPPVHEARRQADGDWCVCRLGAERRGEGKSSSLLTSLTPHLIFSPLAGKRTPVLSLQVDVNNNDRGGQGGGVAAWRRRRRRRRWRRSWKCQTDTHQTLRCEAQLLRNRCAALSDTGADGGNKQSDAMMSR